MQEAIAALERDFKYGGQNWVIGDDQGNFGWTEAIRAPRRAAGHAPWKILPGDGSAEWGADLDMKYIPHAYNPPEGFLATANNDPIGVTDDGDPFFDEPMVDGAPLYLGWSYDPGTRVGRISKRLDALKSAGSKVSVADVQSIQADAFAEWGSALLPVLIDAATSLTDELATPGTHAELSSIATGASAAAKKVLPDVIPFLNGWTFDTPSGAAEDAPTHQQIADSQATLVTAWWINRFYEAALSDELAKIGTDLDSSYALKLLTRAATHPELLKSGIDPTTHDPSFFDDLTTPAVEGRRQIAVRALATALDEIATKLGDAPANWRWGQVHKLTLKFAVPFLDALQIPRPDEMMFAGGFPRHGYYGTVDVGSPTSRADYSFDHGPAIRFVCDLDPTGPHAKNALPGGETFDPASPHYRDQMELWRKNKTFDLAFRAAEVVASALAENAKNKLGRIHLTP